MATRRDYYEILGVKRNATKSDIDRAYKVLALKFHPDRHKDNPKVSEEKFKEVTEAYEILSNPQKREAYDQFGHAGVSSSARAEQGRGGSGDFAFGGFTGDLFGDIFNDLFGTGTRGERSHEERGQDLETHLSIGFLDAAFGVDKQITLTRTQPCRHCAGSGAEPGSSPQTCPTCHGSGQITHRQGFFTLSRTCNRCGGEGSIIEKVCTTCRGKGVEALPTTIQVKIPPGINTGQRLKLKGEGSMGPRGTRPGDLYILIEVEPHTIFQRIDNDIHIEIPINFLQATLGDEIEVPTLHGNVKMSIPPGTQSGKQFRLRHKGVPSARGHSFGDQLVHIVVETPHRLTNEQKSQLEAFGHLLSPKNHPLREAFIEKLARHTHK